MGCAVPSAAQINPAELTLVDVLALSFEERGGIKGREGNTYALLLCLQF